MDQNDTPAPYPHQSNAPRTGEFTRARIFFFVLLPFLLVIFRENDIIVSVITTLLILLSIGNMFDPISYGLLKYCDRLIIFLSKPFIWLWNEHSTSLSRGLKRHRRLAINIVTIIAIGVLLGTTTLRSFVTTTVGSLNDSTCLYTHLPWLFCDTGLGITTLSDGVGIRIGLIADNSYGPFDQTTLNQDERKVENLIFQEDQYACAGQHITPVVATILSRTVEDSQRSARVGLEDLQGSYLAQHEVNATHPTKRICLAIANLGTADTANIHSSLVQAHGDDYSLPQIIHQIAQFARTDPSFRGIVGPPYSQQIKEALPLIKKYPDLSAIPIISPSASSDEFSDIANFYRIVSPDHSQGAAMAQFFCDNLLQSQSSDSIAMLKDKSDAYSASLQLAFNDALTCGNSTHRTTILYRNGDATSIQKAIDQAVEQHAAYIFFPGYEQDMDTVEYELHQKLQENACQVTIIAGDAINNVSSTTHYSYSRVYATSFTAPLPQFTPVVKDFIQQDFSQPLSEGPSHLWLPTDALLTYDAVNAFVQAENNEKSVSDQKDFDSALASVTFSGASGEVAFQGVRGNGHMSDRDQGYVYITCNDYSHTNHLLAGYSIINNGNSRPQELPLSSADGVSLCS